MMNAQGAVEQGTVSPSASFTGIEIPAVVRSGNGPIGSVVGVESTAEGKIMEVELSRPRKPRGFAAMDRSLVSAIARKGGKAAHEAGTAHEFTREEAREAGRKGGQATHAKRRAKLAAVQPH